MFLKYYSVKCKSIAEASNLGTSTIRFEGMKILESHYKQCFTVSTQTHRFFFTTNQRIVYSDYWQVSKSLYDLRVAERYFERILPLNSGMFNLNVSFTCSFS